MVGWLVRREGGGRMDWMGLGMDGLMFENWN